MASSSPQVKIMKEERDKISFNVEELTNILDNGPENTALRRKITEEIQNDPITGDLDLFYKTGEEKFINCLKRVKRLRKMTYDWTNDIVIRTTYIATANLVALPIHAGVFTPTVMNLGSPEQVEKWVPLATDFKIIGTYAQTELGHGTNLRGLETTATFIPETQEFEIDSPKLTAMKWWPGDMAKSSNHAVVMANLIVNGEKYGMHPFIVQIRDLDTHAPMPGIKVGDIGRKFAFEVNDNGFLHMDHVRIPRENMLAGVAEVDSEGNYSLKSDPRLLYGGMMLTRVNLVDSQAIVPMQMACTIATRYSLIRRQGSIKPDGPEVPVMDYVTQQRKILPLIAKAYAFHLCAQRTRFYYAEMMLEMKNGDFTNLPELHALTAGMKAYITERCLSGTDICRRACGGHGYLEASGFPKIFLSQLASVTYEGENTVMYLQCSRHLVKCAVVASSGKKVKGFADYLNDPPTGMCSANSVESFMKHDVLLKCYRHRANRKLHTVHQKIEKLKKAGKPHYESWNMASVELVETAKAHLDVYVMTTFIKVLSGLKAVSGQSRSKLVNLCTLWGLHVLNENIGDMLMDGYVSSQQANTLMEAELFCLSVVRDDALGLVDAFDFTDKTLQSCLGAYDGNVYERLYENAKRSPRNETEVHEEFYKIFKPSLHAGRDILRGGKSKL